MLRREKLKPVPEPASDGRYVLDEQIGFLLRVAMQRHTSIFTSQMVEGLTAEIEAVGKADLDRHRWLVVPRDAAAAPPDVQREWAATTLQTGVGIAVATDFVNTLDSEALRRLERSRLVRS